MRKVYLAINFLILAAVSASACAQSASSVPKPLIVAAPFGVELGKTTCLQAAEVLNIAESGKSFSAVPASAQTPANGYPGGGLLYFLCMRGASTPVSMVSLTLFGASSRYETVVSDLESKYKRTSSKAQDNIYTIEFEASNGNIVASAQKTHDPAPRELLIEVRYNSRQVLEEERSIDRRKKDESRRQESIRRGLL